MGGFILVCDNNHLQSKSRVDFRIFHGASETWHYMKIRIRLMAILSKINAFNEHPDRHFASLYTMHTVNLTNYGNIYEIYPADGQFLELRQFLLEFLFWVWPRLIYTLFKFFILGETWKMDFFNLFIKAEMKKRVPFSFFEKKLEQWM